jgi:hypothetical protein
MVADFNAQEGEFWVGQDAKIRLLLQRLELGKFASSEINQILRERKQAYTVSANELASDYSTFADERRYVEHECFSFCPSIHFQSFG